MAASAIAMFNKANKRALCSMVLPDQRQPPARCCSSGQRRFLRRHPPRTGRSPIDRAFVAEPTARAECFHLIVIATHFSVLRAGGPGKELRAARHGKGVTNPTGATDRRRTRAAWAPSNQAAARERGHRRTEPSLRARRGFGPRRIHPTRCGVFPRAVWDGRQPRGMERVEGRGVGGKSERSTLCAAALAAASLEALGRTARCAQNKVRACD